MKFHKWKQFSIHWETLENKHWSSNADNKYQQLSRKFKCTVCGKEPVAGLGENKATVLERHLCKPSYTLHGCTKHCSAHQQNTADALVGRTLQGLCTSERFRIIDRQEVLSLSEYTGGRTPQHPAQSVYNNQFNHLSFTEINKTTRNVQNVLTYKIWKQTYFPTKIHKRCTE